MFAGRDNSVVVIHFSVPVGSEAEVSGDGFRARVLPSEWLELVRWYCHCIGTNGTVGGSVTVLLPESYLASGNEPMPGRGNARFVGYSSGEFPSLEITSNGADVWVVNGSQAPILDWSTARQAADRRGCDVLVYDRLDPVGRHECSESLRVDERGRVLGVSRHYADSPGSAERWSGTISAVVCAGGHARAVASHLVLYGWGLESVGRLTRRFHVAWSTLTSGVSPTGVANGWNSGRAGGSAGSARSVRRAGRDGHATRAAMSRPIAPPRRTNGRRRPAGTLIDLEVDGRDASSTRRQDKDPAESRNTPAFPAITEPRARSRLAAVLCGDARTYRVLKRVMDVVLSGIALIVMCPALFVVAALVRLTSRGAAVYGHVRQGLGGKEFHCLKFRTMVQGADAMQARLRAENEVDGPQFKISQDPRLTRLGAWLRRYNVDELPQFINVLRGDMSLVGPRPSPDAENQYCPAWRSARLSVKPGITGLWQVLRVREHADSDFQEWIYYDLEYAQHRSLWLDWQILLHTPLSMFAPRRLERFAQRLRRRGICVHSAGLGRTRPAPSPP